MAQASLSTLDSAIAVVLRVTDSESSLEIETGVLVFRKRFEGSLGETEHPCLITPNGRLVWVYAVGDHPMNHTKMRGFMGKNVRLVGQMRGQTLRIELEQIEVIDNRDPE